jgi:4-hydroxybenzoate polyprenyltransferase
MLSASADAAAGYLAALPARAQFDPAAFAGVVAAGALVHAGGVALNDWADRERDRVLYPDRPIPSGRIPPRTAADAAFALLAWGPILALAGGLKAGTWMLAAAVAAAMYDLLLKRWAIVGAAAIAAARACNFSAGMAAAPAPVLWTDYNFACAVAVAAYAFGMTACSFLEERPVHRALYLACLVPMLFALWIPASLATTYVRPAIVFPAWLLGLILWRAAVVMVRPTGEEIRRSTGWHVRGTIVLAASIVAARASVDEAAAVAAVLPSMQALGWLMRRSPDAHAAATNQAHT